MIDLAPEHLAVVKQLLAEHFPETTVWAFGSRVTGTATRFSDLDLVILAPNSIPFARLGALRDALSLSRLPIMVDVLDWTQVAPGLRRIFEAQHEVLQRGGADALAADRGR